MKKDIKYIIKRIFIGVGIILVMSFINSCNVHALTYSLENSSSRINMNGSYVNNIQWGINYWRGVAYEQFTGLDSYANIVVDSEYPILFPGRYLISFVLFSNQSQQDLSCSNIYTNFRNVNKTTGNWVSNEISSKCIDMYKVTYNNKNAWRILIDFTYKEVNGWSPGIDEFNFIMHSNNGYKFFQGDQNGLDIGIDISDIQSYDINIINTWNSDKANQTIINQNNSLINGQNTINNSLNDVENSINYNGNRIDNTLNDSSIPSDSENKINAITSAITTNQNSSIVQLATFIPQTLQLILNGFNTSCTGGYSLGSLYGTELSIPCINPVDYLGSFLWGVIDSILCLCYLIPLCKFLVNKYNDLTSMKNLRWQ